ncbi:MAG: alkaline phytoceramidase, partial [Betaproteobacteria bacterium]
MNRLLARLPVVIVIVSALVLVIHGPIHQFAHYHDFADRRPLLGIPNAADVLSNLGLALVSLWALARLWPARRDARLAAGWPGYLLFFVALLLTAVGSGFYHWAPDNARLVWDRLPIVLACAGLLAAVRAETYPGSDAWTWASVLAVAAVMSVGWWYFTDRDGMGDLRPYLFMQSLPLVLSGLAPRDDRLAFTLAILLYVLAKVAELNDHAMFAASEWISGHTVKHLLAMAAAVVIAARLVARIRPAAGEGSIV